MCINVGNLYKTGNTFECYKCSQKILNKYVLLEVYRCFVANRHQLISLVLPCMQ